VVIVANVTRIGLQRGRRDRFDVRNAAADPLTDLSAEELAAVRDLLVHAGLVIDTTRFVYVGLDEPTKEELAAAPGVSGGRGPCSTTCGLRPPRTCSSRSAPGG